MTRAQEMEQKVALPCAAGFVLFVLVVGGHLLVSAWRDLHALLIAWGVL